MYMCYNISTMYHNTHSTHALWQYISPGYINVVSLHRHWVIIHTLFFPFPSHTHIPTSGWGHSKWYGRERWMGARGRVSLIFSFNKGSAGLRGHIHHLIRVLTFILFSQLYHWICCVGRDCLKITFLNIRRNTPS